MQPDSRTFPVWRGSPSSRHGQLRPGHETPPWFGFRWFNPYNSYRLSASPRSIRTPSTSHSSASTIWTISRQSDDVNGADGPLTWSAPLRADRHPLPPDSCPPRSLLETWHGSAGTSASMERFGAIRIRCQIEVVCIARQVPAPYPVRVAPRVRDCLPRCPDSRRPPHPPILRRLRV